MTESSDETALMSDDKMWRMSQPELERRWKLVREHLKTNQIDALVVQGYEDKIGGYVKWLTDVPAGYPRTVIFHANDLMTVIEHGGHGNRRRLDGSDLHNPGVGEIINNWGFPGIAYCGDLNARDAAECIKTRGYRRIAVANFGSLPSGFANAFRESLGSSLQICDATDFLDAAKARKSPEEIALIRRTASMQDLVFRDLLSYIKPGMRDFEVNAWADFQLQLRGAERGVYIARSAPRGKPAPFGYRHFQGRTIASGDYINILLESNGYGGYWTELGRVICFGRAPSELVDGFELSCAAQAETAKLCRPGVSAADVFKAHNDFMTTHGASPEYRLHAHGQGHDTVERPLIRADETLAIEGGCNLAIHPVVATPTLWVSVCDNYLVGVDGHGDFIHSTPKRIFEM